MALPRFITGSLPTVRFPIPGNGIPPLGIHGMARRPTTAPRSHSTPPPAAEHISFFLDAAPASPLALPAPSEATPPFGTPVAARPVRPASVPPVEVVTPPVMPPAAADTFDPDYPPLHTFTDRPVYAEVRDPLTPAQARMIMGLKFALVRTSTGIVLRLGDDMRPHCLLVRPMGEELIMAGQVGIYLRSEQVLPFGWTSQTFVTSQGKVSLRAGARAEEIRTIAEDATVETALLWLERITGMKVKEDQR